MTGRSRHIPQSVCETLIDQARGRCCLCRELILESSNHHELIAEVLEKHHVVFFSDGGEHTAENLLLVDPTCHRLIHRYPESYPPSLLKETKERWIKMGKRLPHQILYEGASPQLHPQEPLRLSWYPFSFETYGLLYSIAAPDALTVSQFAAFIKRRIVDVIATIDNNRAFLDAESYSLSPRSFTNEAFTGSSLLRDIILNNDSLVLNLHVNVVASARSGPTRDTVTLEAIPGNPKAGQRYEITFSHTLTHPLHVAIEVDGTDGFTLRKKGDTIEGRFSIAVSGGAGGVRDSIVCRGDFNPIRLTLIFGSKLGEGQPHPVV